jgi:hypothetical protein
MPRIRPVHDPFVVRGRDPADRLEEPGVEHFLAEAALQTLEDDVLVGLAGQVVGRVGLEPTTKGL